MRIVRRSIKKKKDVHAEMIGLRRREDGEKRKGDWRRKRETEAGHVESGSN